MSIFNRSLPMLYRRLGTLVQFTPAAGGDQRDVYVLFDTPGGMALEGSQLNVEPVVRVQASDFPQGLPRGDFFTINGQAYKTRTDALPLLDGDELQVELAKAVAP